MYMQTDLDALSAKIQQENQKFKAAQSEISKVIVGQEHVIERLIIALLTDGHLLIEGWWGNNPRWDFQNPWKCLCECEHSSWTGAVPPLIK